LALDYGDYFVGFVHKIIPLLTWRINKRVAIETTFLPIKQHFPVGYGPGEFVACDEAFHKNIVPAFSRF